MRKVEKKQIDVFKTKKDRKTTMPRSWTGPALATKTIHYDLNEKGKEKVKNNNPGSQG